MRFGILGPLLAADDSGRELTVPAARQRTLLAALLARANRVVPVDELVEVVWDGTPPAGAARTLRSYVMRLRQVVGPPIAARILTRDPGYLLQVAEAESDVLSFESLCRQTSTAARSEAWPEAADLTERAMRLWRGAPLVDVPSQLLRDEVVPRLDHLRLQVLEDGIDARLRLGRNDGLVPRLQELTAHHPLRERFHAQLMLALVRTGRRADALEAYRSARAALVEELGVEPGAELRDLHRRILEGDPALDAPSRSRDPDTAGGAAERSPVAVPRQLPPVARHFTGRAAELNALTKSLDRAGPQDRTVVISAIDGMAGVGKTALAVHWAHQHADRFPDGQLYVDLRGYDADEPVPAQDALAGFLRALGMDARDIAAEPQARAGQYRSLLAGRRVLVVLDNARDAEQVRPLLPGTDGCAALVTSRDSLAGLVARDGAERVSLDVLPGAEASALLNELIGPRAAASPHVVEALAEHCCRLPLALRIAAELAAARPHTPLAALDAELSDQERRLDLLDAGGDARAAVRAVFSWSYRNLEEAAARAFRLLGLHPATEVDSAACAALGGMDLPAADRVLDRLLRAHLVFPTAAHWYGMHDLVRAYARSLAAEQDREAERDAALTRLYEHYVHATESAVQALSARDEPAREVPGPAFTSPAEALAWLDAHCGVLVAATLHAVKIGRPRDALRLADAVRPYLNTSGHYSEGATVYHATADAARALGDRAAAADALINLGVADWSRGRFAQAAERLEQAYAEFDALGDQLGRARALGNLAMVEEPQGRAEAAAEHFERALALLRELGDRQREATVLGNLGALHRRQGRHAQAAEHYRMALTLFRELGDRNGEAQTLTRLAHLALRQERYEQAAADSVLALATFRETGNRSGEVNALVNLGGAEAGRGRFGPALEHLQRALALARGIGDRPSEALVLQHLGAAELGQGLAAAAIRRLEEAVALSRAIGHPAGEAEALNTLAEALRAEGKPAQAHDQYAAALHAATRARDAQQQARALAGLRGGPVAAGSRS